MKKFVSSVMIAIMLSMPMVGCSLISSNSVEYAMNVIDLKSESELIKKQYGKIYTIVDSRSDKFTDEERLQLDDIHFAFTETADRIEEIIDNPKKVVTPDELKEMYELAYIGYVNAREIILQHKDVFTSYQWDQMSKFDQSVIEYDVEVREVLDNPDTEEINKTLAVMITLGSAAYKYLLPVLVSII